MLNPGQQAPAQSVPLGDQGKIHGHQAVATWDGTEAQGKEFQILDELRAESMWRVSIVGPVEFDVRFGTKATRFLQKLRSPAVFEVPGQCSVSVRRLVEGAATCELTCTPVYSAAGSCCPGLRLRTSTAADIPSDVQSYFALTASVLQIDGIAVSVPAMSRVPVIFPSSLTSGDGYLEFAA